jgi:hypothetical protein
MSVEFVVPDEMELVAFFGTDPVERVVEDGYWCYEVSDNRGVTLRFSFDLFEQSVQTAISIDGAPWRPLPMKELRSWQSKTRL